MRDVFVYTNGSYKQDLRLQSKDLEAEELPPAEALSRQGYCPITSMAFTVAGMKITIFAKVSQDKKGLTHYAAIQELPSNAAVIFLDHAGILNQYFSTLAPLLDIERRKSHVRQGTAKKGNG